MSITLLGFAVIAMQWYTAVHDEWQFWAAHPEECPGELGAYARNGGMTSKAYHLHSYRIPNMIAACQIGDTAGAHQEVVNAVNSIENWAGQTLKYVRTLKSDGTRQLPLEYVDTFMGLGYTGDMAIAAASLIEAKEQVWNRAKAETIQLTVQPTCLSILAELYRREAQGACDIQEEVQA